MLIKKHRTLFGILVSFVLLFLLCSLITYRAEGSNEKVLGLDAEEFSLNEHSGYNITTDEKGNLIYECKNNDAWTCIAFGERFTADWIFIDFNEPVHRDLDIVIYYSVDGEAFNSVNVYAHVDRLSTDGMLVVVPITNANCVSMRIDIDCPTPFSFKSISFFDVTELSLPKYSLNVWVAVILAVLLLLLVVFEKHIGYFDWIKNLVKEDIRYFKELYSDKRIASLVLHGLMRLINVVFIMSVVVILMSSRLSHMKIIWIFAVATLTLLINVTEKIVTGSFATPERLFLITALIIGVMMSMCFPITTFNVPDEEIHYETSLNISNSVFRANKSFADMRMVWRYADNNEFVANPELFCDDLAISDAIIFDYAAKDTKINFYNTIGYLPTAFMISLGNLIGLSFVQTFIFSKLLGVIVYSFVIALGIKRLKSGGYVISAICLLPSAMILASSTTYDSWVMAFITFGISYFISELQRPEKELRVSDMAIMIGAFILGCGPKAVYFVMMLPLLFMPKNKFDSSKKRKGFILSCVGAMALILLSFMLPFLLDTSGASDYRGGMDVSASDQLKFILSHPFDYAEIAFNFISGFLSFENMSANITSHTYIARPMVFYATVLIFVIMFVTFTDKSELDMFKTRHVIKSVGFISCVGALLLVITALYIAFTPVMYPTINGVQFRYVFPIMPLFFYCIAPARVHSYIDRRVAQLMVYGVFALVTVSVMSDIYIPWIYYSMVGFG